MTLPNHGQLWSSAYEVIYSTSISIAIFPSESRLAGSLVPCSFFLHLFQDRTFEDKWHTFLWTGIPSCQPTTTALAMCSHWPHFDLLTLTFNPRWAVVVMIHTHTKGQCANVVSINEQSQSTERNSKHWLKSNDLNQEKSPTSLIFSSTDNGLHKKGVIVALWHQYH